MARKSLPDASPRASHEPPPPVSASRPEDLVLVRATERGEYGWAIRNPGEVFQMDTKTMREWPLKSREFAIPEHTPVIVTTALGDFELPPWVVLVKKDEVQEEELVPKGHKSKFGKENGDVL